MDRICAAARAENQAAGQRLAAISELDSLWLRGADVDEQRVLDTYVAVSAEVAAALKISARLADRYVYYARAMRDRLPKTGELLLAGDIDDWVFQMMVFRTDLIEDPGVMAKVDAALGRPGATLAVADPGPLGRLHRQDRGPRRSGRGAPAPRAPRRAGGVL